MRFMPTNPFAIFQPPPAPPEWPIGMQRRRPWIHRRWRAAAQRVLRGRRALAQAALLAALGLTCAAAAPAAGPAPGAHPLDARGQMQIADDDRCPVCAMLPARSPHFAAAIQLADGRTFYFCSAGCMLRAWLHPESFLGVGRDRLHRPLVRDYFSGQPLDARLAFWISGSDVIGPMGQALVPLAAEAHVAVFRRRHGGRQVFRLEELNDANWQQLTGKP
jgi:copper chaperone NosL